MNQSRGFQVSLRSTRWGARTALNHDLNVILLDESSAPAFACGLKQNSALYAAEV
jgi:hypothetical protein